MESEADAVRTTLERALGEQYRVLRLLGRGGMGAVYLARDETLERLVAVKVLPADRSDDAASRERFRREARTAARLTHPNIVPLFGFGEAEGMAYLVMGYVRGESLAARLRREGRLHPREVGRIVSEVADALDHAHRQGVVHRDVKPDNILLDDETGRALLADFGIAKALGGAAFTRTGTIVGTPAYMSPEQALGQETIDGRSDLYSLGAVAYALLAGRPPFDGPDTREVLLRRLSQDPPPLASLRPDVPEDLAVAVARCLARDPSERWPDGHSLREALAPAGLDEDQLPEPLDTLDGRGPALLPIATLFVCAALEYWLSYPREELLPPLLTGLTGGALVYQLPWILSAAAFARRRGFACGRILGAFLRQPTWWFLFWYPRRFRRAADVWDRLPLPFRLWRVSATGLLAVVLVAFLTGIVASHGASFKTKTGLDDSQVLDPAVRSVALVFPPLAVMAVVSLALGARYVLALRLDRFRHRLVASALISRPTSQRAYWKRPELARALLPPPAAATTRPPEPRTPQEYVAALVSQASSATGPVRAEAEEAVTTARRLAGEIEGLDAEMARVSRDADLEESARLEQRIGALGPEAEGEPEERRRMRRLLGEQAALLASMAERLESLRAEKARRLDALHALWSGRLDSDTTPTRTAS